MAQIPGADAAGLGNAVATPRRYGETQVARAAFGGDFGQTVETVGAQRVAAANEAARQEEAFAEATRAAANKALALGGLQDATDDLAALGQSMAEGIQGGQIDKTKASEQWTTDARGRIDQALELAPPEHRADMQRELDHKLRIGERAVGREVTKRDQHDVRTGLDQTLEVASRQYLSDPAGADRMVQEALATFGPNSGLAPDQLARLGQNYREKSRLAKADALINVAQRDTALLDKVAQLLTTPEFDQLDPQQRTRLEGRIEIYRNSNADRVKWDKERLDRAREHQLKVAEAAWNVGNKLSYEGVLNGARAEELLREMTGTPYAKGFAELIHRQRVTGSIASQSPQVVQAALDAVNVRIAKEGVSEDLLTMRNQINKVQDGQMTAIRTDGVLRAAGKYGRAEPPKVLDWSAGLPSVIEQLREREPAVTAAAQWAGKVEILYPEEATKFAEFLQVLPVEARAKALNSITGAFGAQASQSMAAQIDHKDKAMAYALTSNPTPLGQFRSEMLLRGQQAMKDGTSTKGQKLPEVQANLWKSTAAAAMDGAFGDARTQAKAIEAATLIMHGIASQQGGALTKEDTVTAMHMAVGGEMIPNRGRTIVKDGQDARAPLPVPEGYTEDMLDKRLRSVVPAEIWPQVMPAPVAGAAPQDLTKLTVSVPSAAGGYVALPVADFLRTLPGQELMPYATGRYVVIVNGRPVVSDRGTPIVIGVQPAVQPGAPGAPGAPK